MRPSTHRLCLTTEDLARLYKVTPATLRNWICQGKLTFDLDPVKNFEAYAARWAQEHGWEPPESA